ncbi:TfoX/Sxy family protein [Bacteroidota bacterium]
MAYDKFLADRIRNLLKEKRIGFEEREMMGGLCYMVNDKMCVGIVKNDLMARIDPGIHEKALTETGCREMDFTGRPMKGYVFIDPTGVDLDSDLEYWVDYCLEFNPKAKSSKKKK